MSVEVHYTHGDTSSNPNSKFPVLVYRQVLPKSMTCPLLSEPERSKAVGDFFTLNDWEAGGTWPSVTRNHYHPNVHEVYAIIQGSSTLILGLDAKYVPAEMSDEELLQHEFLEIEMKTGDVVVLPAGTSHCSKQFSPDYRYVSAYPSNGEKWKSFSRMHVVRSDYDHSRDVNDVLKAAMPLGDPVYGRNGALTEVWTA